MAAVENKELLERITELGERSAMGTDIEIVEIQLKGAGKARLLRVYIDKPGGVTHGDCELISQRFGLHCLTRKIRYPRAATLSKSARPASNGGFPGREISNG